MRQLRNDVQVLRAIAVLSVLIFHFDLPWLHKGFLGVDIFFVISGFLMSRVIIDALDQQRFSAKQFYLRRARRLLPAAFATLCVVTAIAPWVLAASALRDYATQLLGAISFSANIVLWQQSGYFDGDAALKPLLHTWSLALEEQYYFVLPLVLVLAGRRWRLLTLLALLAGSATLCLWWLSHQPSAAFYLLPSRAWELLIGSLCALPAATSITIPNRFRHIDTGWVLLPLMAISLIWGLDAPHPRGDALLVCLCTAGLILWPSRLLNSSAMWLRPMLWIGDRSYSLYLVHWPLIALAKHIWLEGVPEHINMALLLTSFGLAHVSYVVVELRFKEASTPAQLAQRMLSLIVPLLLAAAVMGWKLQETQGQQWATALRPNYGLSTQCEYDTDFEPRAACRTSKAPRTLVWGDSYAMHIVPAVVASPPPGGVMQATRSVCAPTLDYARRMPQDPDWRAPQCLAFTQSVLDFLADTPEIEYVVISSRWQYYFDDPVVNAQGQPVHLSTAQLAASVSRTIGQIRQMGKKVILVSPPPLLGPSVNLGTCAERHALGLLTVGSLTAADCSFDLREAQHRQAQVRELLQTVARQAQVDTIWLEEGNCRQGRCASIIDGQPIYRDFGHLSVAGSAVLGQRLKLGELIIQKAR